MAISLWRYIKKKIDSLNPKSMWLFYLCFFRKRKKKLISFSALNTVASWGRIVFFSLGIIPFLLFFVFAIKKIKENKKGNLIFGDFHVQYFFFLRQIKRWNGRNCVCETIQCVGAVFFLPFYIAPLPLNYSLTSLTLYECRKVESRQKKKSFWFLGHEKRVK